MASCWSNRKCYAINVTFLPFHPKKPRPFSFDSDYSLLLLRINIHQYVLFYFALIKDGTERISILIKHEHIRADWLTHKKRDQITDGQVEKIYVGCCMHVTIPSDDYTCWKISHDASD